MALYTAKCALLLCRSIQRYKANQGDFNELKMKWSAILCIVIFSAIEVTTKSLKTSYYH